MTFKDFCSKGGKAATGSKKRRSKAHYRAAAKLSHIARRLKTLAENSVEK